MILRKNIFLYIYIYIFFFFVLKKSIFRSGTYLYTNDMPTFTVPVVKPFLVKCYFNMLFKHNNYFRIKMKLKHEKIVIVL